MVENTTELTSLIITVLTSVGAGVLLGIAWGRTADINSGRFSASLLKGRRLPVLTSVMSVIALLAFSGAAGFMNNPFRADVSDSKSATNRLIGSTPPGKKASSNDPVWQLEDYVKKLGPRPNILTSLRKIRRNAALLTPAPSLPAVDTMIARLANRLKNSPNDIEGWRMLGWSYLNTKNYDEAVASYERALKLDPGSEKLQAALTKARGHLVELKKGGTSNPEEKSSGQSTAYPPK